jgi:hypothetical protein
MSRRRLFLTAILLGTGLVGPMMNYLASLPYAIVSLKLVLGHVTLGMLLSRAVPSMIEGTFAGFVSGVVCGIVRGEPRRAAIGTTQVMLPLWTALCVAVDVLGHRGFVLAAILNTASLLFLYGVAAALTGYWTTLLARRWLDQCRQAEPPSLSTTRPRPTRYRI